MRDFWDDRAREDALFFVDNRRGYGEAGEEDFWAGGEEGLEQLLAIFGMEIQPSDVVLDIGCGVGRFTRALAQRAQRVISLDVSEEMLEKARELNPQLDNVDWVLGDGRSLAGVDDQAVDVCVSHVVFQHIPDPRITLGYIEEVGRVLKPKGWALIQVSNDPQAHRPRAPLACGCGPWWAAPRAASAIRRGWAQPWTSARRARQPSAGGSTWSASGAPAPSSASCCSESRRTRPRRVPRPARRRRRGAGSHGTRAAGARRRAR